MKSGDDMKIALIRHLAPSIAPGICYGRLDVAADPATADQIAGLAANSALLGASRIWTSPARRCRVLADALAVALPAAQTVDARLQELDFGAWEGKSWDTIPLAALDRWAASPLTFAPPGGESGAALVWRLRDFCADLTRDQQNCVVVSHGGPLKVLIALSQGRDADLLTATPSMGSVTMVTWPAQSPAAWQSGG
jgi:alpha-ribazole phosphatase